MTDSQQPSKNVELTKPAPSIAPAAQDINITITNSPPMAVLPLNSSSKLDQEPNPFEQSFSGATAAAAACNSSSSTSSTQKEYPKEKSNQPETPNKPVLPPVASITSPAAPLIGGGLLPKEVANQFQWDTLRTGPLSPSMLQGPAKPDNFNHGAVGANVRQNVSMPQQGMTTAAAAAAVAAAGFINQSATASFSSGLAPMPYSVSAPTNNGTAVFAKQAEEEQKVQWQQPGKQPEQNRSTQSEERDSCKNTSQEKASTTQDAGRESKATTTTTESTTNRKRSRAKTIEDDEKRRNFLERNRIAALKCRQRKKQWLNNLQAKVELLTTENEQLQVQAEAMREEIVNLKTLLLAHKDCPVAQANGFTATAIQKSIPTVMPQQMMRPGSGVPMQNQPVFASHGLGPSADLKPVIATNNTLAQPRPPVATAAPFRSAALSMTTTTAHFNQPLPITNMMGMPVHQQGPLPPPPPAPAPTPVSSSHHPQQGMMAGVGATSGVLRF